MRLKSKQNKPKTDFKTDIPEYNDEEILDILRKRKYYQKEAVDLAMEEALKRELIHSEHDFLDDDFEVPPLKFRVFPLIEDDKNRNKIRKSIARGTLILGILPTVWGFLRFNQGNVIEGGIMLFFGVLWIFLAARLIQKSDLLVVDVLFVVSAVSVIYVAKLLLQKKEIIFMDLFIVLVLYGFLTYGLLYIRRLHTPE